MTEKWGEFQGKWDLDRVSGGVRVIRARVTGVLLYLTFVLHFVLSQFLVTFH